MSLNYWEWFAHRMNNGVSRKPVGSLLFNPDFDRSSEPFEPTTSSVRGARLAANRIHTADAVAGEIGPEHTMASPIFTATADDLGPRRYTAGEVTYPAVGTVLKATAKTFGLDRWKAEMGEDLAETIREESAARGRQLEADIDGFLFGGVEPEPSVWWTSVRSHVLQLQAECTDLERQVVVVHDLDRYAGTLDLRCRRRANGRKLIADWKSKSGRDKKTDEVKVPTRSKIYDNLCQVAAYCDAEAFMTGERPDGEVVIALPDRAALVFPVTDADYARWRQRLAEYHSRG